jgi:peroxiredoxin
MKHPTLVPALATAVLLTAGSSAPASDRAEVGEAAPDFALTDTEGKEHRLTEYLKDDKVVVLEWFNPDCPFVKKHHKNNKTMATTYGEFAEKDLVWLAINSGGPGKQGYGLERNRKAREDYGIEYPVLIDEDGTVGKLYGAKTTPHMFVIAKSGELLYAGAIDDNRSAGKLGDTNWVSTCLEQVFSKETVETAQTKPYGCSVKYASSKGTP